jgi:phospholipase C
MSELRGELGDPERNERLEAQDPEGFMRRREFLTRTAMLAGAAGLASALPANALLSQAAKVQTAAPLPSPSNIPIDTFVVLMMENRSFDHYFGWYSDKTDAMNAGLSYPDDGNVQHPTHPLAPDFQGCAFNDPDHSWEGGRRQYNGGAMDGFRKSPNDEFAIGYYEEANLPFIPQLAHNFTLYDRYFCSILSETWPNRLYMHSGTSGGNKVNASPQDAANANPQGGLYRWETIWDKMQQAGLSVTYYFSDLPFIGVFGRRYNGIVKPADQFAADAAAGNLSNLNFIDPPFADGGGGNGLSGDEHPHGDIRIGQAFMSAIALAFVNSAYYQQGKGAMFVNYDEWGGFFDHVPPKLVPDDRQDPDLDKSYGVTGFRIPGVAISPYTRAQGTSGRVSHQTVTHDSILKLISYTFGLGYLNKRHRYASNIGRSFDWANPNFNPPSLTPALPPLTTPCVVESPGGTSSTTSEPQETLGSPEFIDYLERAGYEIGTWDPTQFFSGPNADRLKQQIEAAGVSPSP